MSATDTVSTPAPDQHQDRTSLSDINRRSAHWHTEYPHNKAFAALFYTSLLRNVWEIFHFHRRSNPQAPKNNATS